MNSDRRFVWRGGVLLDSRVAMWGVGGEGVEEKYGRDKGG